MICPWRHRSPSRPRIHPVHRLQVTRSGSSVSCGSVPALPQSVTCSTSRWLAMCSPGAGRSTQGAPEAPHGLTDSRARCVFRLEARSAATTSAAFWRSSIILRLAHPARALRRPLDFAMVLGAVAVLACARAAAARGCPGSRGCAEYVWSARAGWGRGCPYRSRTASTGRPKASLALHTRNRPSCAGRGPSRPGNPL